ncbi:hypothetical protein A2U01_0013936 [Trifolium medium]|uniref:Uncharacterized protein n=1 Tax=Trifolium medium TaxID=97028 RepID=A0A392MZM0_9FABA|nr:hypothetical protein [Trifolium medium]
MSSNATAAITISSGSLAMGSSAADPNYQPSGSLTTSPTSIRNPPPPDLPPKKRLLSSAQGHKAGKSSLPLARWDLPLLFLFHPQIGVLLQLFS